jgi:hypothetical protein
VLEEHVRPPLLVVSPYFSMTPGKTFATGST